MLAPLGVIAPGCSAKPAAKKRGKGAASAKRPETGLAELAGDDGSRAPAEAATGAADPPAEPAATPAAADTTPADANAGADSASAAGEPAAALPASAPPEAPMSAEPAEPEPIDPTTSAASLDGLAAAAGNGGPARPTSKLIDADTALLLDGGRVEVCSPLGWTRSPRSQNYLVRYQPGPRKSYPSIVVTAEPAPAGLEAITGANQAAFVAAIGTKLAETFPANGPVKLIKKPAAATLGSHAGVAWALPGTAKVGGLSESIDRYAYGVVLGGRLYTVEARAPQGKIDDDAKAAAKAVAATLFRPEGAPAGNPDGAAPAALGDATPSPAAN